MRSLFLVLLLANLVFFAIQQNLFGNILHAASEPERLANEIEPTRIKLLRGPGSNTTANAVSVAAGGESTGPSQAPARPAAEAKPATVAACVEMGGSNGLNVDDAKRVQTQLAQLQLGPRLSERKSNDAAGFVVNLPPFKSKAEAERAAAELRRIGVEDFFVIQDATPQKFGISLGVFKSEDAAKAHLTALTQRGVRNARVSARPAANQRTWYQVRDVDAALAARLADLRQGTPLAETRDCS